MDTKSADRLAHSLQAFAESQGKTADIQQTMLQSLNEMQKTLAEVRGSKRMPSPKSRIYSVFCGGPSSSSADLDDRVLFTESIAAETTEYTPRTQLRHTPCQSAGITEDIIESAFAQAASFAEPIMRVSQASSVAETQELRRASSSQDFSTCVDEIVQVLLFDPRFREKTLSYDGATGWVGTILTIHGRPRLGGMYYCLMAESLLATIALVGFEDKIGALMDLDEVVTLTTAPFTLVGGGLMFLVVFRSQTSYAKWDDARKIWCQMTSLGRDIAMQSTAYIKDQSYVSRICRCLVIYMVTVRCWLRREDPDHTLIGRVLDAHSHARLVKNYKFSGAVCGKDGQGKDGHVVQKLSWQFQRICAPLCCLEMIREVVDKAVTAKSMGPFQMAFDNNIKALGVCLAGFERLTSTRIPFAYVSHLRTSVVIYLLFLPIALYRALSWWTIPAVWFVGYVLIGLENLSVEIEDPFGYDENDLPMDQYCAEVARDIRDIVTRRDVWGHHETHSMADVIEESMSFGADCAGGGGGDGDGDGDGD